MRAAGVATLALLLLAGCAARTRDITPVKVPVPAAAQPAHEGQPYQLVPQQSLLTILVYRGGTLARAGHNHVVASHDLAGMVYVPQDLTRAFFEVRIPVAKLTVDEAELRAQAGADFPPEVAESAREGTRRNMVSAALLDAEHFPEIVLRSEAVDVTAPTDLLAHVQTTVKDKTTTVTTAVHYELSAEGLKATGEFPLKHSELGLTPFSVMLGAIQVQDEMKVRFNFYFSKTDTPGERR